jgi:hypothetical protein
MNANGTEREMEMKKTIKESTAMRLVSSGKARAMSIVRHDERLYIAIDRWDRQTTQHAEITEDRRDYWRTRSSAPQYNY